MTPRAVGLLSLVILLGVGCGQTVEEQAGAPSGTAGIAGALVAVGAAGQNARGSGGASVGGSAGTSASGPTSLAALAGHTFALYASDSIGGTGGMGSECPPASTSARYALVFSQDGSSVTVIRTDPVQEENLTGTKATSTADQALYPLVDSWTGGELMVWVENNQVFGQLRGFGSGIPVLWCIRAALKPLP